MKQMDLCDTTLENTEAGFRLNYLEVRNWGTFDKYVWNINPNGQTTLMAGDNGSGKSTVVDAVISLLIPHNLITFNKTSGGKKRDRSFYSYLRGAYKNIQDEQNRARPEYLRTENDYTVILGCFYNKGYDQQITLAQVFWLENGKTTPKKMFVVANRGMTIEEDFSGFGTDIRQLKKRLKLMDDVRVFDTFKDYGNFYRKRVGIDNEKALELFQQMVSMKKVGVLTNFIREHMIDKSDIEERVDKLCQNFENLNQSHEAVIKAEAQLQMLEPIADKSVEYRALEERRKSLENSKDSLDGYFAHYEANVYEKAINKLNTEFESAENRLVHITDAQVQLEQDKRQLEKSFDDNGGARMQALRREIEELRDSQNRRRKQYDAYLKHSETLGFPEPETNELFSNNRTHASNLLKNAVSELTDLEEKRVDLAIQIKEIGKNLENLDDELESLKDRKSKLPISYLKLRQKIADKLEVPEEELPFACELVQVKPEEREWEGAIERLMQGFGLTMLVPEELYDEVRWYVNNHRLEVEVNRRMMGIRLVYMQAEEEMSTHHLDDPEYQELITKLDIIPNHSFEGWLESHIRKRFDYICCDDASGFDHYDKALTKEGQIKTYQRHEKDDRKRLTDSSRFILGWSNQQKVEALEEDRDELREQGIQISKKVEKLEEARSLLETQKDHARLLLTYDNYDTIHWQAPYQRMQELEAEQEEIESSSDLLKTMREKIESVKDSIVAHQQMHDNLIGEKAVLENKRKHYTTQLEAAQSRLKNWQADQHENDFAMLDELRKSMLSDDSELSLETLYASKSRMQDAVVQQLAETNRSLNGLSNNIIKQMTHFADRFPVETSEFEASMDALKHWENLHQRLKDEDLPRHRDRFKNLLNEGTINSLALFKHQLEREEQEINKKIQSINESLQQINYDKGTYIVLVTNPVDDPEIKNFRAELKHCLAKGLEDDDFYNETKFAKVKALIERFKGREGHSEEDKRWRTKVTDVRNWLNFNASERWRDTEEEREFYSGTSTKSTGQQEKLAYTVLASAIAYQFGLEWGATHSRSFRFVVIDEAFSVGSDKNTRYALELFKQLNLQVLIVTPLQKLHVIEHYIRHVHFIHNNTEGSFSQIENLPIETYHANKSKYTRVSQRKKGALSVSSEENSEEFVEDTL